MAKYNANQSHSASWIFQTWASFAISITATAMGILYLPVDSWIKGYLGMGLMFSIGSTISLSKTVRDMHESSKFLNRIDEAKLEKLLAEYDPFKK
ncbi:hypothetical protein K9N68_18060 [Kovacikia minuta CCNUW1]|uniref:YiaA/YiaB family inner membrane protein n=1 Tax=Kovacikia minuta TaxID=2931930 RepID=UPI001CCA4370|nr:YiaA/YiaB family inner membrane protein [Kovacikia minuta]UBF23677.1 hypothetical protein K9N68_18060 [Kovacikia minuta CCNUW1]